MSTPHTTLSSRLRSLAETRPNATFCTFIGKGRSDVISRADLFYRSRAYAAHYRSTGIRPGDIVLVILEHTPHLFYSYLGAVLAGAIPSFMPFPSAKQQTHIYWKEHAQLFARIQPRSIVTYEQNAAALGDAFPDIADRVLVATDALLEGSPIDENEFAGFEADADDTACLQHSSGTTGLKKGVMLTHRAIFEHLSRYATALELSSNDRIASWLPLYHDMGFVACFLTAALTDVELIALDPFEWVLRPKLLLDAIERTRATLCWLPNFAFNHLVNTARPGANWDLSSVRAFINCSEPCKPRTFERFLERFAASGVTREMLHVCYAMAENIFAVTQTALGQPSRTHQITVNGLPQLHQSCGTPVDGVRLEIRDSDARQMPEEAVGRIHIASPYLFNGYYGLPEQSAEKLRDGWYDTGDLGFVQDNELFVTGRTDDMLIVNGRNYYAHEIEALVHDVEGIIPGRCAAIAIEDPLTGATSIVVLAECSPGADGTTVGREARQLLIDHLGLEIRSVVPLQKGTLAKTTSGKISRVKNKELYLANTLSGAYSP